MEDRLHPVEESNDHSINNKDNTDPDNNNKDEAEPGFNNNNIVLKVDKY